MRSICDSFQPTEQVFSINTTFPSMEICFEQFLLTDKCFRHHICKASWALELLSKGNFMKEITKVKSSNFTQLCWIGLPSTHVCVSLHYLECFYFYSFLVVVLTAKPSLNKPKKRTRGQCTLNTLECVQQETTHMNLVQFLPLSNIHILYENWPRCQEENRNSNVCCQKQHYNMDYNQFYSRSFHKQLKNSLKPKVNYDTSIFLVDFGYIH